MTKLDLMPSTVRSIKETAAKIRKGEEAEISAEGIVIYLDALLKVIEERRIAEVTP